MAIMRRIWPLACLALALAYGGAAQAQLAADVDESNVCQGGPKTESREERGKPKPDEGDSTGKEDTNTTGALPDANLRPLQYFKECLIRPLCESDGVWKSIEIDGYIDNTVTCDFNEPEDRINTLRVFDRKDRAYLFNLFQLYMRKDPTDDSRWGFATRLNAGWDADAISSYEEANADKADIEELYASYLFPVCAGKGLLVKAGKFVTLAGAEVIEQKDNWNISRSFLFGYAIPFTHTGVRAQYLIDDKLDITFGINRGWDAFRRDPNGALTYEARVAMTCSSKFNHAFTVYCGPEQADNTHSARQLLDWVGTYKFSDKLTGMLNADLAHEEDASADGSAAKWKGVAGYLRYECTDRLSCAARAEVFHDEDGARTGIRQTLWETTLTAQYKFRGNLWGRLEYRHDQSNTRIFTDERGFSHNQNTVAASVLMTF